jgi:hypothetical protein
MATCGRWIRTKEITQCPDLVRIASNPSDAARTSVPNLHTLYRPARVGPPPPPPPYLVHRSTNTRAALLSLSLSLSGQGLLHGRGHITGTSVRTLQCPPTARPSRTRRRSGGRTTQGRSPAVIIWVRRSRHRPSRLCARLRATQTMSAHSLRARPCPCLCFHPRRFLSLSGPWSSRTYSCVGVAGLGRWSRLSLRVRMCCAGCRD